MERSEGWKAGLNCLSRFRPAGEKWGWKASALWTTAFPSFCLRFVFLSVCFGRRKGTSDRAFERESATSLDPCDVHMDVVLSKTYSVSVIKQRVLAALLLFMGVL